MELVQAEVVSASEKQTPNNMLAIINERSIAENMVESVRNISIVKPQDLQFLSENAKHLSTICEKTFIWRTKQQKLSIIHDQYHPTLHSKFHQSILECKVFFEQAIELAKQAEILKLKIESLYLDQKMNLLDKEELEEQIKGQFIYNEKFEQIPAPEGSVRFKRLAVKLEQLEEKLAGLDLEIGSMKYQLQTSSVAMNYRMREIRDWKEIQDQLIERMLSEGYTMEGIWDKEAGEAEAHFYLFLGNFQAVHQSKDSGEIQNLTALARHGVDQAIGLGKFSEWVLKCNGSQLKSLVELGYVSATKGKDNKMLLTSNNVQADAMYKESDKKPLLT